MKCGPEYEKYELGIGKEILTKAVASACGSTTSKIRESVKETGDLGLTAQKFKMGQKTMNHFLKNLKPPAPLTIEKVFNGFVKIARAKGNNSMG